MGSANPVAQIGEEGETVEKNVDVACTACFEALHFGQNRNVRSLNLFHNLLSDSAWCPSQHLGHFEREGEGQITELHLRWSFHRQPRELDFKAPVNEIQQELFNGLDMTSQHEVMITKSGNQPLFPPGQLWISHRNRCYITQL